MKRVISSSANGRVNLLGEHLDYNGGAVLPLQIDKCVKIYLSDNNTNEKIVIKSKQYDEKIIINHNLAKQENWSDFVIGACKIISDKFGIKISSINFVIDSDLPIGIGLSSSAAITVGSGGSSPGGGVANGGQGYVKVGLGVVTGWEGGTTTVSIGDVFESGSADADDWDVDVYDFGDGSGVTGNFKKPTETPIIKIIGGGGTGATATCTTSANGTVNNVTLTSGGSGYTEQPYAYVLNGSSAGTIIAAQVDQNAGIVSDLTLIPNSSSQIESFLKFGGVNGKTSKTRFAVVKPTDCTQVNYISIKAARGNDSNGGNKPEETLKVYYQLNGSETWNLIDTIINPNASRTDPLIGTVPSINSAWDGTGGNTKWYTYSVALPSSAKQDGVKIKFEQQRANANSANDNADNTDHYGISEVIYWKEKVTELIFVPTAGAISKPAVDSLTYTVQGQTGPGITYSSGLNASDAKLTMKSTTKVEPIVSLDPDFNIPLLVPYRLCKYLIKAF